MPAYPSSSIPSGVASLCQAGLFQATQPPHLLTHLATLTNPGLVPGAGIRWSSSLGSPLPRSSRVRGRGDRPWAAAADASRPVDAALGVRRDPLNGRWAVPAEATIRRTLARLDA